MQITGIAEYLLIIECACNATSYNDQTAVVPCFKFNNQQRAGHNIFNKDTKVVYLPLSGVLSFKHFG